MQSQEEKTARWTDQNSQQITHTCSKNGEKSRWQSAIGFGFVSHQALIVRPARDF